MDAGGPGPHGHSKDWKVKKIMTVSQPMLPCSCYVLVRGMEMGTQYSCTVCDARRWSYSAMGVFARLNILICFDKLWSESFD